MRCRRLIIHGVATLVLLAATFSAFAQRIITTSAGNIWTFRDNGRQARDARLGLLRQVVLDSAGNLIVADAGNHLVVKISADGTLTVLAGNGIIGFSGEGDSATGASMNSPGGVVLDGAGNFYIADSNNNVIRKRTPDGRLVTIAGSGRSDFSGDGGPAAAASLNDPAGLALDALGNLYIADWYNHRIRKIGPDGRITTVAGNGKAAFSGDGGPATSASLESPLGVAVDRLGNLYIADSFNQRIRKVGPDGTITTVAGNGRSEYSGDEIGRAHV